MNRGLGCHKEPAERNRGSLETCQRQGDQDTVLGVPCKDVKERDEQALELLRTMAEILPMPFHALATFILSLTSLVPCQEPCRQAPEAVTCASQPALYSPAAQERKADEECNTGPES